MNKLFAVVAAVGALAASSAFAQYVVYGTKCVTPYGWTFMVIPAPVGSICHVPTPMGPVRGYVEL
ncbi:MAG: hypothetical protein JNM69_02425 [Archangium sp.]|nr:hypothetical protein [Archangium sp.]